MTIDELMDIGTKDKFYEIMNRMALSDRQIQVFELKYLRQWFSEDIAAELNISRSTVNAEIKVIKHKLRQVEI